MPKLKTLKPKIKTIDTRIAPGYSTERIMGYTREQIRKRILLRDDYTCRICGRMKSNPRDLEVDHIRPLAAGGRETDENRQTLCISPIAVCNECFPKWQEVEVYTVPPILPCAICGKMDQRKNGGVSVHTISGGCHRIKSEEDRIKYGI